MSKKDTYLKLSEEKRDSCKFEAKLTYAFIKGNYDEMRITSSDYDSCTDDVEEYVKSIKAKRNGSNYIIGKIEDGMSPGHTYTLYGYAKFRDGKWYKFGKSSITTKNDGHKKFDYKIKSIEPYEYEPFRIGGNIDFNIKVENCNRKKGPDFKVVILDKNNKVLNESSVDSIYSKETENIGLDIDVEKKHLNSHGKAEYRFVVLPQEDDFADTEISNNEKIKKYNTYEEVAKEIKNNTIYNEKVNKYERGKWFTIKFNKSGKANFWINSANLDYDLNLYIYKKMNTKSKYKLARSQNDLGEGDDIIRDLEVKKNELYYIFVRNGDSKDVDFKIKARLQEENIIGNDGELDMIIPREYVIHQGDYPNIKLGESRHSVSKSGCYVSSIAMIISWYLKDSSDETKLDLVRTVAKNCDSTGNYSGDPVKYRNRVFKIEMLANNCNLKQKESILKEKLLKNKPLICQVPDHFVVANGYNEDKDKWEKYSILDPGRRVSETLKTPMNYKHANNIVSVRRVYEDTPNRNITKEEAIQNLKQYTGDKKNTIIAMGTKLLEAGYEISFVAGMLGNILSESYLGHFEGSNYRSNPSEKPVYLKYVDEHFNYAKEFSGKNIMDVGINKTYKLVENCKKSNYSGTFGLGAVQWTAGRTYNLMEKYRELCKNIDKPTVEQCGKVESTYLLEELNTTYKWVYEKWKNNCKDKNCVEAAREAGKIVCLDFERPHKKKIKAPGRGKQSAEFYEFIVSN